ncbi:MAG: SHOCT domain-containing protein [Candidatus Moranbacteria bacterium]|nr:SHOCT domain-containing protein [Candidatus Moranbacteria bacterium]
MMGYYGHMGGLGFGFGFVFMLIFWVLIFFVVMALIRGLSGRHGCGWHGLDEQKGKENKALDILKERYAKGEISKEDFEKMKKDLE